MNFLFAVASSCSDVQIMHGFPASGSFWVDLDEDDGHDPIEVQ